MAARSPFLRPALAAFLVLAALLHASASHPQAVGSGSLAFTGVTGNEWWVQVRLTGSAATQATRVEAMDENGPWVALTQQSWTSDRTWWAGSFRIEPGHDVRFRATLPGAVVESCWFAHPSGTERCGSTPAPGFDAMFTGVKGNEWWVQASVSANEPLAGVDARVGCTGSWHPLAKQSWGGWAASFRVPSGSTVDFRARATSGATDLSGGYVWPQATPTTACGTSTPPPPPPPGGTSLEAEAFAVKTTGGKVATSSASGGAAWNLWTNGHIEDRIRTESGQHLVVVVRGTPLGGVWPHMQVRVDGALVFSTNVASTSFTSFRTPVLAAGDHVVRVAYTNDAPPTSSEDRNLIVDVVRAQVATTDATVRVDTGRTGGAIDPRIYSFNVASWEPSDFAPPNPTFVGMLKQLDPALLRFPPGHDGQHMYFDPTNTMTSPPPGFTRLLRADVLDHFVAAARQAGAEPMIEINVKTGTPEMAARLVRYVNVERGYGIRWFEIGNEPDLNGGGDPWSEAERFLRFERAMRAVDPGIRLVGGAIMTGANAFGTNGRLNWMDPLADGVGSKADALSWHWYPLDSEQPRTTSSAYPSVAHLLQETAPDWHPSGMGFAEFACSRMKAIRGRTGAEHWITELGPDSGAKQAPGITDGQVAAVWFADVVPRLAECGTDAVFQFAVRQQRDSVLVLMTHDRQPTPAWGTYQLLASAYRGSWLPAHVDGTSALAAHAARGPDGKLGIVLANKGAHPLTVDVDAGALTSVQAWTLEADSPTSTTARVNGRVLDRSAVLAGFPAVAAQLDAPIQVPPYSVVVLRAA